jgi:hypothetical protein
MLYFILLYIYVCVCLYGLFSCLWLGKKETHLVCPKCGVDNISK